MDELPAVSLLLSFTRASTACPLWTCKHDQPIKLLMTLHLEMSLFILCISSSMHEEAVLLHNRSDLAALMVRSCRIEGVLHHNMQKAHENLLVLIGFRARNGENCCSRLTLI